MDRNGILYRVYKSFSDDSCYDHTVLTGKIHPFVFISSTIFAFVYSLTGLLDQMIRHGAIDSPWVGFGILKDIELVFIAFELVMFLLFVIADYDYKKTQPNYPRVTCGLVQIGVLVYAFFGLVYINTYLIQERLISNYHLEIVADMGMTNSTRDQAIGYFVDKYAKLNKIDNVVIRQDGKIVNTKTDNYGLPYSHRDIDRILKEHYTPTPAPVAQTQLFVSNPVLYRGIMTGLQQVVDHDYPQQKGTANE